MQSNFNFNYTQSIEDEFASANNKSIINNHSITFCYVINLKQKIINRKAAIGNKSEDRKRMSKRR